ncbi:phosphomannomutase [Candidatus Saccharibacteria bacterium]|nr:phosphomannomutase [Candidatus Saccharibacteria bacterium]
MDLLSALTYSPVELSFGTSGLRGLIEDMTDLECYINTTGFLKYLTSQGFNGREILIAGDLRDSTPRIKYAVAKAVHDANYTPVDCGFIPTPALAYAAQEANTACIMVTGSHIPADRNGIKFYRHDGEVLKADEAGIKAAVADIRRELYALEEAKSQFSTDGSFKTTSTPESFTTRDISAQYLDRFTQALSTSTLEGKTVVVYQHSAVGRDLLVALLQSLGAIVITEGRSDEFVPIDTENVTAADQAYFTSLAQKYPHAFAIVSTDGDSDRPFVIDENGLFHRGDELGAVVATALEADFSAYPISSSDALDTYFAQLARQYVHTKIGSPHVIVAMKSAADDGFKKIVGWEVNGGFLTYNDISYGDGTLRALPTRDAFLPICITLAHAANNNSSVSKLFTALPPRATQAGLIDNFPQDISQSIISHLSGPEDVAKGFATKFFTNELGFGAIEKINSLDGIRLYFSNGDIAHIRPSGNAPQLRIYGVANNQARADEIVSLALAEPHGIYRQMEAALNQDLA